VAPNAAAVLECTKGNVDITALLGLESFSLAKAHITWCCVVFVSGFACL
jgi:hypothetical protein